MSWPLASFTLVGLVLRVGWLAYERARPSARMVAVVATLAAVAALGRDAFVALPDVKPITAIALVVGYALGPLPGFSVGAMGMLASNVMLGQGSYTPWQMAAWGLVGLIGAALGRLSGRRLGRLPLALACAVSALLAKEIMNVYTWTLGATHTPAAFLLVAGRRAALRPHRRGRELPLRPRLRPRAGARAGARALAHGRLLGARPPARRPRPPVRRSRLAAACARSLPSLARRVAGGRAWRHARRRRRASRARPRRTPPARARASPARSPTSPPPRTPTGAGAPRRGSPRSELYSAWAAIGLAAAGRNPQSVRRDGHTVLDALRGASRHARRRRRLRAHDARAARVRRAGDVARGQEPAGGAAALPRERRLLLPSGQPHRVRRLRAARRRALARAIPRCAPLARGSRASRTPTAASTSTCGAPPATWTTPPPRCRRWWTPASAPAPASNTRSRSCCARRTSTAAFPQQPGGESNAQSTAWAVQGLTATGRNVEAIHRAGSRSPLGYLESLVAPNGSVRYSRTSAQTPVWVTAQALTALARAPFPIG